MVEAIKSTHNLLTSTGPKNFDGDVFIWERERELI